MLKSMPQGMRTFPDIDIIILRTFVLGYFFEPPPHILNIVSKPASQQASQPASQQASKPASQQASQQARPRALDGQPARQAGR